MPSHSGTDIMEYPNIKKKKIKNKKKWIGSMEP